DSGWDNILAGACLIHPVPECRGAHGSPQHRGGNHLADKFGAVGCRVLEKYGPWERDSGSAITVMGPDHCAICHAGGVAQGISSFPGGKPGCVAVSYFIPLSAVCVAKWCEHHALVFQRDRPARRQRRKLAHEVIVGCWAPTVCLHVVSAVSQ